RAGPRAPRSPRGCRTAPAPGRCTKAGRAATRPSARSGGRAPRPAAAQTASPPPSPASPPEPRASGRRGGERTARRVGLRKRPYAVFLDDLAVELDPPAVPELLDHVPVDPARVHAADLREPGADREVDGARHLLVEQ